MADYSVYFARSARKELERLPHSTSLRVFEKIERLAVDPRPTGVVKLHGQKGLWRIRAGDYRIVYAVRDDSKTVEILVIRHRRDVYRDF